eukprot:15445651-Alexandrium_andersonii.AAC.1
MRRRDAAASVCPAARGSVARRAGEPAPPLSSIKKRGRWRADASVRRHEKATPAQKEANEVPQIAQTFAARVEQAL